MRMQRAHLSGSGATAGQLPAVRRLAATIICLTLAGCAHRGPTKPASETAVAYTTVDAPGTARYELRDDENSNTPVQIQAAAPTYPAALIGRHIAHVDVRAKVVVDAQGAVSDVHVDHAANAEAYPEEFDAAVLAATASWRYVPLRFQRWEEVLDAEGNVTDSRLVEDEARPFSLDYEFSFDVRDGKPIVTGTSRAWR
ncbi:MAG TPA: hypothetical protein VFE67_07250 [Rudaea sp.]|nr:hypothetical protein [Rudaea sp.]